jgi:hypothetical protein
MRTPETIRRVPWTCSWGRFGEPAPFPWPAHVPRLVFWTCAPDRRCVPDDPPQLRRVRALGGDGERSSRDLVTGRR